MLGNSKISEKSWTNEYAMERWERWRNRAVCVQWNERHDGGVRHRCERRLQSTGELVVRVVCSSLEFVQSQPPNMLPSSRIGPALSNDRMSEIKNGPP